MSPRTKDRLPNGNFEQKSLMGAAGPKTFQNGEEGSDKWYKSIWDVWRFFWWFQVDAVKVTFQGIKGAGLLESILPGQPRTSTEETSTCLVCFVFRVSAFWAPKETFSFQTWFLHMQTHSNSHTAFVYKFWTVVVSFDLAGSSFKMPGKKSGNPASLQGFVTSMPGHVDSLRWCTCPWYIHQLALESWLSVSGHIRNPALFL